MNEEDRHRQTGEENRQFFFVETIWRQSMDIGNLTSPRKFLYMCATCKTGNCAKYEMKMPQIGIWNLPLTLK